MKLRTAIGGSTRAKLVAKKFLLCSGEHAVQEAAGLINPATYKPYDVIIDLGSETKFDEVKRVVAQDHFDATANAAALAEAIDERFGHPLIAHTLDLHSNGSAVGITALLQSRNADATVPVAFQGVKRLDCMGPDIGYGGQYLDADHVKSLQSLGVKSVDVYRISGDIVPELGQISGAVVSSIDDQAAIQAFKFIASQARGGMAADAAAKEEADVQGAIIHFHEVPAPGPWLWWSSDGGIDYVHFVNHYIEARTGNLPDASSLPPQVRAEALGEQAEIEKALAGGDLDDLARALHLLGAKLSLADQLSDRTHLLDMMRQLEAAHVRLDQRRLDARIEALREQQQALFFDQLGNRNSLKAIEQVITVRQRQKLEAARQARLFAEWSQRNSTPDAAPLPSESASSNDDSGENVQHPARPNPYPRRQQPPPERHAPYVPLPSRDPFQGT